MLPYLILSSILDLADFFMSVAVPMGKKGSDGEEDRVSDFHFNVPGFESRFGHRNFSSTFHHSGTSTLARTIPVSLANAGPLV
jgi:hypothetical protein